MPGASRTTQRAVASELSHYQRISKNNRRRMEMEISQQMKPGGGYIWKNTTTKPISPRLRSNERSKSRKKNCSRAALEMLREGHSTQQYQTIQTRGHSAKVGKTDLTQSNPYSFLRDTNLH
jgi:hypothetical protein